MFDVWQKTKDEIYIRTVLDDLIDCWTSFDELDGKQIVILDREKFESFMDNHGQKLNDIELKD
jgi:hypothetical protein